MKEGDWYRPIGLIPEVGALCGGVYIYMKVKIIENNHAIVDIYDFISDVEKPIASKVYFLPVEKQLRPASEDEVSESLGWLATNLLRAEEKRKLRQLF